MGREGAVLCHCLYAWAVSYGVDERGHLDTPEGELLGPINLLGSSEGETKRQADRQRRTEKTYRVVRTILREIDEYGILRKPSWDGVRVLLLILPLTEGLSTAVERQAMHQATLSQVFMLCSAQGLGYDGLPASLPESSVKDEPERRETIRMRILWYAFLAESMLSGLRGSTLLLTDNEDVAAMEASVEKQPLVNIPDHQHTTVKMALAPIQFGRACHVIHAALTSQEARRREVVNMEQVRSAWDALDKTWDAFESIKLDAPAEPFRHREEVIYFADSWKICIFEALVVVRKALEDRVEHLNAIRAGTRPVNAIPRSRSTSPTVAFDAAAENERVKQLLAMAKTKTELRVRQILDLVQRHLGSRFFEWDAPHARDGTYWAAVFLAREGGTDDDVGNCLRALNDARWAFAQSPERTHELRQAWLETRQRAQMSPRQTPKVPHALTVLPTPSLSESPFTSPTFKSTTDASLVIQHGSASWPSSATMPSSARFSPPRIPDTLTPQLTSPAYVVFPHNVPSATGISSSDPSQPPLTPQHRQHPHHPHHAQQLANQSAAMVYPPGQVVVQADGSRVFVPFDTMP